MSAILNQIPFDNLELSNPFWEFSLELWRHEGLQKALLYLQDEKGHRVNSLLLAIWASSENKVVREGLLSENSELQHWHEEVVAPLRSVRKAVPKHTSTIALRKQIQAQELAAEQIEQALLYQGVKDVLNVADTTAIDTLRNNLKVSGVEGSDLVLLVQECIPLICAD